MDKPYKIAEIVINPIIVMKRLLILPLYFLSAGTLAIAYMGIKNKIMAMTGPPKVSIIPKMLGLIVATIQQLSRINNSIMRCKVFLLVGLASDGRDFSNNPCKPSF